VQKLYENPHFGTMLIYGIFGPKTLLVGQAFGCQPDMLWWLNNGGKRVFHAGKSPEQLRIFRVFERQNLHFPVATNRPIFHQ
jgi:hypothetical protein